MGRPVFLHKIILTSALGWKVSTVLDFGYLMKMDLCVLISSINDQVRCCFFVVLTFPVHGCNSSHSSILLVEAGFSGSRDREDPYSSF